MAACQPSSLGLFSLAPKTPKPYPGLRIQQLNPPTRIPQASRARDPGPRLPLGLDHCQLVVFGASQRTARLYEIRGWSEKSLPASVISLFVLGSWVPWTSRQVAGSPIR